MYARRFSGLFLGVAIALGNIVSVRAQDLAEDSEFFKLGLAKLLHVRVTSVTKMPEKLFTAPAAAYVMDQEDLHRSGATSITEALRTVPGLQIGSIDAHRWAVSSRGFNSDFANKLLVLKDGRSVYSPLHSGVYWDVQDSMMDDLNHIEVVRGPGASVWGANAVNGVINIISKDAKETQGLLISSGGGNVEQGFGAVRYGGRVSDNAYYRVYTRYFNRSESLLTTGAGAGDCWWMSQSGFRIDWDANNLDLFTLQGDVYRGQEHQTRTFLTSTVPVAQTKNFSDRLFGGNILGRWTHTFSEEADLKIQTYYDRSERESSTPSENRDTLDFDLQSRFQCCERNTVLWGAGCRVTSDNIRGSYDLAYVPVSRTDKILSAFLQDELAVMPDRLKLVFGSKFEHNDYTGFEIQPSARLAWTPTARQTFWTSVSRAVRTPSRAEDDVRVTVPTPFPGVNSIISGDRSGVSERLIAYELGYRVLPHDAVSCDIATFYNVYDRLRSLNLTSPFPPALTLANQLEGESYGVEVSSQWQVAPTWLLRATYTFLRVNLHDDNKSDAAQNERFFEGCAPRHQFSLRSSLDLTHNLHFDSTLRYVDELYGVSVPRYFELDLRLAWDIRENLELAVVGQNLLGGSHPEFSSSVIASPRTEVQRSIYAQITWRF